MKNQSLVWLSALILASGLGGCGGDPSETASSSSSTSSSSSSNSSSSSSSSTSSSSGMPVPPSGGYSALPDGKGGVNYEGVAITPDMNFDKTVSQTIFATTLYPHLRDAGCGDCHNSATEAQAPLHSDNDLALAHEYALTQVNFKNPKNSKVVTYVGINRHHCPRVSCKTDADEIQEAVDAWKAGIAHMLMETPRSVPADENVTTTTVESWIAADKSTLATADKPYVVYTSLHELHNEELSADQLNIVRVGLSKALNSVARWAPQVVNPTDVTGQGILYKFDIRSYWGYNQGVTELFFGGSDDDLAFGNDKRDYLGQPVNAAVQNKLYNFTNSTVTDPQHALRIWQRILHGSVEGGAVSGTTPPNINGFRGRRSSNGAGEYIAAEDFEWVEAAQLIYTLTRPDVYNAIMMNPFYADELERNLEVDTRLGVDSYDYMLILDAHSVDSRLALRGKRPNNGWYWKTFDTFSGMLASGGDRSIYEVYADPEGKDIRFPFWANPIPQFVKWQEVAEDNESYSFIATLAQTMNISGLAGFTHPDTAGCDNQPGAVTGFGFCRHYTGTGGGQQSHSGVIHSLPNGLQGYYIAGGFNQRRVSIFTNTERDPRRLTSADDNIAYMTGYSYTNAGASSRTSDPRLIVGSSCIGCHADGPLRASNDLRHWLDTDPARLPKGEYGVDGWIDSIRITNRVKQLYPTRQEMNQTIEQDRKGFLETMGKIKNAMILGVDKNMYVEPVIWTVEYVQRQKYNYPDIGDL